MGIIFQVHNELGPSLLEKYYQRAIEKELKEQGVSFKREQSVDIFYKDEKIGKYFLDFTIEDLIILETKAQQSYSPKFFRQALAYLKQLNLPLAIIVNFRTNRIDSKRIVNPLFKDKDLLEIDSKYKL